MIGAPLSIGRFDVARLDAKIHNRKNFQCGVDALDRYLLQQATQDVKRKVAACFVAEEPATKVIAGYYTLATASVPLLDLPDELRKRLPRYEAIPAFRMGRLAVDLRYAGLGLGSALLVDGLLRAAKSEIPAAVMMVDAKDSQAAAFYQKHGFIPLQEQDLTLILPLASVPAQGKRPEG